MSPDGRCVDETNKSNGRVETEGPDADTVTGQTETVDGPREPVRPKSPLSCSIANTMSFTSVADGNAL